MKKPKEQLIKEATLVAEYVWKNKLKSPTNNELREYCRLFLYNPRFDQWIRNVEPSFYPTFINNLMQRFIEIVDKDTGRKPNEPLRTSSQADTASSVAALLRGMHGREPLGFTAACREVATMKGKTAEAVSEAYKNILRKAKQESAT